MTTSGTTSNDLVRDVVIKAALRLVKAYSPYAGPRADQVIDASEALGMMLSSWQIQGFLWVKEFVTLPLVSGTSSYSLPDEVNTTFRPTRIFSATRKSASGNEVPLTPLSRSDYMSLPNKTSQGTPTQYYYDPQLATGKLYLWPAPSSSADSIVLDVDRPLQMMIDSANTFDFPQEWLEVIKYGLAVRIAPEYTLPLNERALLQREFSSLAENLLAFNMDHISTFIGANING